MRVHKLIKVYDKIDAFVTPSEFQRKKLIVNGFSADKLHCIPTFAPVSDSDRETETGTYGLYFGRVDAGKGVDVVINAYEKMPDKQLKIMGDDDFEESVRLREYVKQRGLNNIEFLGFKGGTELEEVIKSARFTLIPSIWYDNLPNTALESFQYSKPVIASNIGSLPELVIDGVNGYLFEPGNADDLKTKIELLDDDEKIKAMGTKSRSRLEDRFAPKTHYDLLMSVFEKVKRKNECN